MNWERTLETILWLIAFVRHPLKSVLVLKSPQIKEAFYPYITWGWGIKVRKEKNVCVVVVVALSWYRALLTSSVQQQQQHKHFFLSLLYKVSQNKIGFWIFQCWILFWDRLVKLDNLSPVIIIIMSRIFPMEHCDSLTPLQSLF